MATLVSPGVNVTITDESFYASAGPGTVPLIFIATKQDKSTPDGTTVAPGTLKSNAGKLYLVSSQRELLQTFGDPDFNEVSGTAQNGYALNEYGLLAAYSYLGLANRAYIVRADVDLGQLEASSTEPTGVPLNGTHWNDLNEFVPGLFEFNGTAWVEKTVVVTEEAIDDLDVQPSAGFSEGDVVMSPADSFSTFRYLQRIAGVWHVLGTSAWATATSNAFNWAPHTSLPPTPGTGDLWLKTTTPNKGLSVKIKRYDSTTGTFVATNDIAVFQSHTAYYASPGVNPASVPAGRLVAFQQNGTAALSGGTSEFKIQRHNGVAQVLVTGSSPNPVLGLAPSVTINGISIASLTAGDDIDAITLKINSTAGIAAAGIVASKTGSNLLTITNTSGNDVVIAASGAAVEAQFTFTTNNLRRTIATQTDADFSGVSPEGSFLAGLGYGVNDVVTLTDGTVITVTGVSSLVRLINPQDETNYTGGSPNGTFAPGLGYTVGNTLTLTGGHGTITVDAISTNKTLIGAQTQTNFNNVGANGTFAAGVGYANGNTITLNDGSLITVNTISATKQLIVGQDETNFDNVGANGAFVGGDGAGGTAYVAADTITLNDGSVITVDAVDGNGDVTQFTVTTVGTTGFTTAATLTQTASSGTGTGFTLTTDTANESNKGDIATFTVTTASTTGFATASTLTQTSTTGTGTGFTLTTDTANEANKGDVTQFTIATSGTTGFASGSLSGVAVTGGSGSGFTLTVGTANETPKGDIQQFTVTTAGSGVAPSLVRGQAGPAVPPGGTGFQLTTGTANETNVSAVSNVTLVSGGDGYTTAGSFTITAASDAGFVGTAAVVNYTLTGDSIASVTLVSGGSGYTPSLGATAVNTTDAPNPAGSGNGWSAVGMPAGIYSNFQDVDNVVIEYVSSVAAPVTAPADGTLWYSAELDIDLMENDGLGAWRELDTTFFVQPSEPTTGLSAGVLWLDTDQIDEYPVIYRRNAGNTGWDMIDNADQTTPAGIIFADARAALPVPQTAGADATSTLDADAPDPLLYPAGMLLWNTRLSTRNVKVYRENYTFEGVEIGDRWVTASGNRTDGSPYMGQDAVKQVIIEAIGAELIGGEEIRSDTIFYNLIAAPGFPELIDEMLTLNTDRKETAFIIGDSPFHLAADSTSLQAWATNANGAASNGDDGLLTANPYLGVYYPSGLSTNVDGSEVVVPASHMMLRTIAYNDQVSYPWFAPAGFARGTVSNAVSVGYLNAEDEFVPVTLNQGQRDILYTNNVNPIAFIPGRGLVVYGQKTRNPVASALDRVNVARLINYIRFQAEQLAQPFLFEPNDSITRGAVKGQFDTFLAELITLRGLYDFLVVCDESNNTPARIDRNELWVDIAIQPVKAVEFIYIPIRIRNTGEDLTI
jgi:Phage tail sheath C-terminal domain